MSDFSAEWLALREPADHGARSARLAQAIAERSARAGRLRIVDLAAGTGSNARYLAPRLGPRQHWRLVDRDAALLRVAARQTPIPGVATIAGEQFDLSTLDPPSAHELFEGAALVTASALLDLVSDRFIAVVASSCRSVDASVLFALTYDGRIECSPRDPHDEAIRDLVNRHQRRDKGFGPALGPAAVEEAVRQFRAAGFDVDRDRSDWRLTTQDGELQRQLIEGWAHAAGEMATDRSAEIGAWRSRRLAHVSASASSIVVGHEDIAAWPRGMKAVSNP